MSAWIRDEWQASAELLHARPMPRDGRRRISWLRPIAPALILGSSSPDPYCGLRDDLVRRRSGGGLVWLDPAVMTWVDVFVPTADPLWCPDISQAFHWLGRRMAAAFADLGVPATMHRGPYEAGPSGGLICFASLGPGEVTARGRKLVGISQRRTREGSRFQCLAYERFEFGPLESVTDADTSALIRDRAAGWADFGVRNSPSEIAKLLTSFITAQEV